MAQELLKESDMGSRRKPRDGSLGRRMAPHGDDRWGDIYANTPVRKMIAMYDYDPQELSPNVDSEVMCSLVQLLWVLNFSRIRHFQKLIFIKFT